jgi:peroxiredoxin Q/BCP
VEFSVFVGANAPDFELMTDSGEAWKLSAQAGNVVALLFYPKDETLVCTKQMCSVRDHWSEYLETKAVDVGVSPGNTNAHSSFRSRHDLPLTLLADAGRSITALYGSHWLFPTSFIRSIIVIDAGGVIRTRSSMLRMFRPSDESVISSIYAARGDAFTEKFAEIKKVHGQTFKSRID